jgi:lipopolysaccharide transport system ATP-binding protein
MRGATKDIEGDRVEGPSRKSWGRGVVDQLLARRAAPNPPDPPRLRLPPNTTILHITHWKAGSQWFRAILQDAFGPAVESPALHSTHLFNEPVKPGKVYPCAYINKSEFDCLGLSERCRYFVVIRDLRDTLVSGYFSWRNTHRIEWFPMEKCRRVLNRLNTEAGMLYMIEEFLPKPALFQRSWLDAGTRCRRLEDFVADPAGRMGEVFEEDLKIEVDRSDMAALMGRNTFLKLSGGREAGQEDVTSHYRKGMAGDWKLHFTPAIKSRFKQHYNDLLIRAGYESDDAW